MTLRRASVILTLVAGLAAALSAAGGERGFRGFLVMRGAQVLASENADQLFVPGSVRKLIVAAAALHHLGPDHRVVTELRAAGEIAEGTLRGDLVVRAAGDPTWNARFFKDDPRAPLKRLARELAGRGIERVTGDLVVDTSRFPGRPSPLSRPTSELAYAYGAPSSALAVDENTVMVEIAPGRRVGERGRVRGPAALRLLNHIRTVSRERHDRGTVDFLPVWRTNTIVVRGEYPVSEPGYRVELSVPYPDRYAAEVLRAVLRQQGIALAGQVKLSETPVPAGESVLAQIASPPLAALLGPLLRDSHNWYAEMLLRHLAAELGGEGRRDEGLAIERQFLEEEVGLSPEAFVLDDASGLSPYNLLSPEAAVALLRYVRSRPWRELFVAALATPGKGTLAPWGRLPPLAAKTGTIRHTLALAGYLDPGSPEPVVFACFLNHRDEASPVLRAEMAALVRRWAPAR